MTVPVVVVTKAHPVTEKQIVPTDSAKISIGNELSQFVVTFIVLSAHLLMLDQTAGRLAATFGVKIRDTAWAYGVVELEIKHGLLTLLIVTSICLWIWMVGKLVKLHVPYFIETGLLIQTMHQTLCLMMLPWLTSLSGSEMWARLQAPLQIPDPIIFLSLTTLIAALTNATELIVTHFID